MSTMVTLPSYDKTVSSHFFDRWFSEVRSTSPQLEEALGGPIDLGHVDFTQVAKPDVVDAATVSLTVLSRLRATEPEFRYGVLEQRLAALIRDHGIVGDLVLEVTDGDQERNPCQIMVDSNPWTCGGYLFGVVLSALHRAGSLRPADLDEIAHNRILDINVYEQRSKGAGHGQGVTAAVLRELLEGGLSYPIVHWPEAARPADSEVDILEDLLRFVTPTSKIS